MTDGGMSLPLIQKLCDYQRFPLRNKAKNALSLAISFVSHPWAKQAIFRKGKREKKKSLSLPRQLGVPYPRKRIERQAEIKPFEPDTGNAGAGNRVPHHSSIDLMNY